MCCTVPGLYIQKAFFKIKIKINKNTKQGMRQKCHLCSFDLKMIVMSSAMRFNNTARHVLRAHEEL